MHQSAICQLTDSISGELFFTITFPLVEKYIKILLHALIILSCHLGLKEERFIPSRKVGRKIVLFLHLKFSLRQ